jgi:hypothetical protein
MNSRPSARVVKTDQLEIVSQQDFQILQNLVIARIHSTVSPVRMLTLAEARIRDGHDFTGNQIVRPLHETT